MRADREAREAAIQALARRQHGAVSHRQLIAAGLKPSTIHGRVRAGALHVVHRGVYAVGRPDLPVRGHWMAAVLACGRGALLSHRACAALRDLIGWSGGRVDVTVPRRSGIRRPGVRVHRSLGLAPSDRDEVEGIPCTSLALTLLDLAATAPRQVAERACDNAERRGLLDLAAIGDLLERKRGQPGTVVLGAILGSGRVGDGVSRSYLEQRFLALCARSGIPRPAVNVWMPVAGEEIQCDFVWFRERVVVEVDGWGTHRTRRAFREDRRRDRVLIGAGWRPLRFTGPEVLAGGHEVKDTVLAALANRWPT